MDYQICYDQQQESSLMIGQPTLAEIPHWQYALPSRQHQGQAQLQSKYRVNLYVSNRLNRMVTDQGRASQP